MSKDSERRISDMLPGEVGYTTFWTMFTTPDGLRISLEGPVSSTPEGTLNLELKRTGDGFETPTRKLQYLMIPSVLKALATPRERAGASLPLVVIDPVTGERVVQPAIVTVEQAVFGLLVELHQTESMLQRLARR